MSTVYFDNNSDRDKLIDSSSNRNKNKIRCLRCNSYILQPNSCVFHKQESAIEIPSMRKKKDLAQASVADREIDLEKTVDFWLVDNMMTFENIGFTNTVENKKYLICADCEIGPIGLQNLDKPNEYLVCLDRVKYE
jgi:hypothetical protein